MYGEAVLSKQDVDDVVAIEPAAPPEEGLDPSVMGSVVEREGRAA